MRFVYTLTIPADTKITDPTSTEIKLIKGRLKHVEIGFPPGCAGMVKVVIMDENIQISPANPEMYHAWDNYVEAFSMNYSLENTLHELTLVGWSPDTVYDHVITFRFDVDPQSEDDRDVFLSQILAGFKPYGDVT